MKITKNMGAYPRKEVIKSSQEEAYQPSPALIKHHNHQSTRENTTGN